MVSPLGAGVLDDNVAEELRHQLLALDLAKAVPRVRGLGSNKIKHLHLVALRSQILARFLIKLGFRVCDNK